MNAENTLDISGYKSSLISFNDKVDFVKKNFQDVMFDVVEFMYANKKIKFFHAKGDYLASRIIAARDFYEAEFLKFFSFFNVNNGLVLDIGGNIGNHSVYFSSIKEWGVIAFEPIKQNALCLAINADLNGVLDKIFIVDSALGKAEGHCYLSKVIDDNAGSYSRVFSGNAHSVAVTVRVLDNIPEINDITDTIGLIKIDVEGMEYDVLQGAVNTLQKHKPALAFECTSQNSYTDIVSLLSPLGYFPMEILNHTATFIFLNKYNNSHVDKLAEYLTMYVEQRKKLQYHIY
ncbi:FkbM family methyltransferase [Enterobacter ludwigii]|uniref:FkbM family methyltransferase n=1 Tax=Enterobacter ludwigii TaxID=299767 RepID=UPI003F6FE772